MKEYQLKKCDEHIPHSIYMQVIWTIRSYKVIQLRASSIILEQTAPDGQPRGNGTSNPTEAKAIKREVPLKILKALDDAIAIVPEEYRKGVLRNIINREPFPEYAHPKTYARWKQKYICKVAEEMGLV